MSKEKSCLNCPSLVESGQQSVKFFGKSIGVPVCGRFGKPIGTKDTKGKLKPTEALAKSIASSCDAYGKPAPERPDWSNLTFDVALPDITAIRFNRREQQAAVLSCNSCEHFVREDVVAENLGYPVGMCAVRGRLLLSSRYVYEARGCDDRSLAINGVRTSFENIQMLPEYLMNQPLSGNPVVAHQQQQASFVDPREYVTDMEVSTEDAAKGIRAWRKVQDPLSDNFTFLPIYNGEHFTPEERAKVPQVGDDEHPEDYIDHGFYVYKIAVLWRELDETPGVHGEAGTGKTELFRHLAWLMQLPYERVSITASSELDDLAGKMHYSPDKGTYWRDGRLVSAWSKPCVLVLDEPNTGPPEVWQFIRPMTDNSKQLVLDMSDDPSPRDRHDDCYLGLAMNPAWDPKNVGTHVVGDADVNRLMHISIPLPPEELEREIITKRCSHDDYTISPATLDAIMKIAADIRALCQQDALPVTWAIRPQLKVARATRWFDLKTCYRMAVADFLEPSVAQQILEVVESHVE